MNYTLMADKLMACFRYATRLVRQAWNFLRQVTGDDAYERYLEYMSRYHPQCQVMTPEKYYSYMTEQNGRRSRCC